MKPIDANDDVDILPRKRVGDDSEMDITPMIDITFLLLIFFLVASKMDTPAPVALPPAKNGSAVGIKNSVVLTIIESEKKGIAKIYKGESGDEGRLVKAGDLAEQEAEMVAYIEAAIADSIDKTAVLIKAGAGVKHRDVGRVAKAVAKVTGIEQLHVAVKETQ